MSTTNQPEREKEIFEQAIELASADERLGYLKGVCGGDGELLARVQTLLRAHDESGAFLPGVPGGGAAKLTAVAVPLENTGTIIGRYKILQAIGEGGCGTVYMAEQEQPVRRRVALKVIKLGMDTKEVIARFEAERQALAMMDHPNIAKVLDAGATETGRPFFVMELVRGVPITKYCDDNNLPTVDRLKLFAQVCYAVQHAHQKGIIHRDIKPSNILVTLHDGLPVPKVIDFGIAKATQGRLTDSTMFTAFEQFIGTPAYMSPEQAELSGLDIDTRADIYSLGVLLYELLTGRTPFDPQEMLKVGLDEMRRHIREVEPMRPSTQLSALEKATLTTTALHRRTDALKLIKLIDGDLDWIVMRCLEKDRTRRYETANGLALDLQRHLDNEPIAARPPSAAYRFQKMVRRNRFVFAGGAVVAFGLIVGAAVATWQAVRAIRAEQAARVELRKSEEVAQFLTSIWGGVGPAVLRGRDTGLFKEFLDQAAQRLRQELADQPEVQSWLYGSLGLEYQAVREFASAEAMMRQRLAILRKLHGNDHPDVIDALGTLAYLLQEAGDLAGAEAVDREALVIAQRSEGPAHDQLAELLDSVAGVQDLRGDFSGAVATRRELVAARRLLNGADDLTVATALESLAKAEAAAGDPAAGEVSGQKALGIRRKQLRLQRQQAGNDHVAIAASLESLASSETANGEYAAAENSRREALAIRREQLGPEHPLVAQSLVSSAEAPRDHGAYPEAEGLLRGALAIRRREPASASRDSDLRQTAGALVEILLKHGNIPEAEALARESLAAAKKDPRTHDSALGVARVHLVNVFKQQGNLAAAEAEIREHLALLERHQNKESVEYALWLGGGLATVMAKRGDLTQAEVLCGEAIAILRKHARGDQFQAIISLRCLAVLQDARGDLNGSIATRRTVLGVLQKHVLKSHPEMSLGLVELAADLVRHGDFAEAEGLLSIAWQNEEALNYFRMDPQRGVRENFAKLYLAWSKTDPGKTALAAEWQGKIAEFNHAPP